MAGIKDTGADLENLDVKREYLNREYCLDEARRLLRSGIITGMSEKQLAGEIFFHAAAYYFCEKTGLLPRVRYHAEIIDIDDGGDTMHRRAAYAAVWRLAGLRRRRR